jgi:hypothetical protein
MLMVWVFEPLKELKMSTIRRLLIGLNKWSNSCFDYYDPQTIPDVVELDELETFVGSKKAARPRTAERRKGMLANRQNLGMDDGRPL